MLSTIADILARSVAGQQIPTAEAALTKRDKLPQPAVGTVGVIPIYGVLIPRGNLLSNMSGATSYDSVRVSLNEMLANEAVKTIVLDIDSPGGSSAGMAELSRDIMRARTKKPIVAVAQYTMASAAYGLGSAATEIVAAPSATVGGIGVYAIHDDLTKALEELGVKRTYISAGKYKLDGNTPTELTEQGRQSIQSRVDAMYTLFVAEVSRGRGVSVQDVRNGFGQGAAVTADEALDLKMVDKIATLEETIARLTTAPKASRAANSESTTKVIDTPQEPSPATGQDRTSDVAWKNHMEFAMLGAAL